MTDEEIQGLLDQTKAEKESAPEQQGVTDEQIEALLKQTKADMAAEQPLPDWARIGLQAAGPGGMLAQGLADFPLTRGPAREFLKSIGRFDVEQMIGGAAAAENILQAGSAAQRTYSMSEEALALQEQLDKGLKEGTLDSTQVAELTQRIAKLQQGVDVQAQEPQNDPLGYLAGKIRPLPEAIRTAGEDFVNLALPTSQEMDNSTIGKIASGAGTLAAQLPFAILGGEVGGLAKAGELAAFALQLGGQQYQDAKAHGATEDQALNASFWGSLTAPAFVFSSEIPAAALARKLAGSTPMQALLQVGAASVRGGATMYGTTVYQNLVARLTGYDPNRPLTEGALTNALVGSVLDTAATTFGASPELAKFFRPAEVEVRERAPTKPLEADQPAPQVEQQPTTGAAAPVAEGGVPASETGAPTGGQVQRTAAAATATQPAEVLATPTSPEEELAQSKRNLDQALGIATGEAPVTATEPTAEAQAANIRPTEPQPPPLPTETPQEQANIRGEPVPPPLPEEGTALTPQSARDVVTQAQNGTGLQRRILFAKSIDDVPKRVRGKLSQEQHGDTAQMIYDKTMGQWWVVGDRFRNAEELHRALIEETIPRIYNDASRVRLIHDPNDPRLGHYDIPSETPVLNTHALLRTEDPFLHASKTAIEEINVHKGFSKLFGSREAPTYAAAMKQLRQYFKARGLEDSLAREKGFKNLDQMAKAYRFDDHETNAAHANALTEELAGAYAQRFKTQRALDQAAPRWYQRALDSLIGGISRRFGQGMNRLDVQQLLSDSMAAVRKAKFSDTTQYHPGVGEAAKADMFQHQLANLRGPEDQMDFFKQWADAGIDLSNEAIRAKVEAQERTRPTTPGGMAARAEDLKQAVGMGAPQEILPQAGFRPGDIFVERKFRQTERGLEPGQGTRQGAERSMREPNRPFSERMNFADKAAAVYDKRSLDEAMAAGRQVFESEYGGDARAGMQGMEGMSGDDPMHAPLRALINEAANREIQSLKDRRLKHQAWSLENQRDRWNEQMQAKSTLLGQALNALKLLYESGESAIGRLRAGLTKSQDRTFRDMPAVKNLTKGIEQIKRRVAKKLTEDYASQIERIQAQMTKLTGEGQVSLADRYINAIAQTINTRMGRLGFTEAERPILQEFFNRFQSTINQIVKERMEPVPKAPPRPELGPTATVREAIGNEPMLQRAWDETVSRLKTENPNQLFFSKLENALDEPFSREQVAAVLREKGANLKDIIYNHFTTQREIGRDLSTELVQGLGLSRADADRIQNAFEAHYQALLRQTAGKELQRLLDQVGTKGIYKRAKGELQRLTELMAIGALDRKELHNLLSERYGLGSWNPVINDKLKAAGDVLRQLRDEHGPEVYKNMKAAEIADLIQQSQGVTDKWIKRAEAVWMASLLTGPFTHGKYYMQNVAQIMTNLFLRTAFRPGTTPETFSLMVKDLFNGMVHAAKTELPFIVRTGYHTMREVPGGEQAGMRAEGIPFRSALESLPFAGDLKNPLNWYRYVGRVLQGMETVMYRGAHNAITRALAIRLAEEKGMSSPDAIRLSEQIVYGTEADRNDAVAQALREQKRFNFSDDVLKQRTEELITEKRAARSQDLLPGLFDEAHRFALHSVYRESPAGVMGGLARHLNELRRRNPAWSMVVPFINLPANVANEFMSWSPIGIIRGRDSIPLPFISKGGTEAIRKFYKDVPHFERLVESGNISERELRDLSYEYLAKGVIGTLGIAGGITYSLLNQNSPDPFFSVTAEGPPNPAQRDALKARGWRPYSIKLGNTYLDYGETPWKLALGIIGGGNDIIRYSDHPDATHLLGQILIESFRDGANSIMDSSFLQGLQSLLAAGSGGGGRDAVSSLNRFLSQQATSAAGIFYGGTGTRQIYKLLNPTVYEAHGLGALMARNIPFVNGAFLRPHLNILGEPVESRPIEWPFRSDDPVFRFLDENNIKMSVPNSGKKVDGQQLSADELHDYAESRGHSLREALTEAIADGTFEGLDKEERDHIMQELEHNADAVASMKIREQRDEKR